MRGAPVLRLLSNREREADERLTDAELVALATKRDPRAAALIWDRYAGLVRALLFRTLGPDTDIDDLVQDVFIGLFRNVESLRDPAALRAFLFGIALRVAKTALRKRRVRRWFRLTDSGDVPDVVSTTGDAGPRAALSRLHRILGELGDRERLAFVLRHGEGYELTETAEALGCSLATVKRALSRANEHVQRRAAEDPLLQPYLGEEHGHGSS